jgi:hypothetical protein
MRWTCQTSKACRSISSFVSGLTRVPWAAATYQVDPTSPTDGTPESPASTPTRSSGQYDRSMKRDVPRTAPSDRRRMVNGTNQRSSRSTSALATYASASSMVDGTSV